MSPDVLLKQCFGFFIEELEGECLLCDGTRSMADIIAFLQQEYPDAQSAVVEDVRVAVEQLVREGALLEAAAP